jgi:hypothetical protein
MSDYKILNSVYIVSASVTVFFSATETLKYKNARNKSLKNTEILRDICVPYGR